MNNNKFSKTNKLGAIHHFVPQSYLKRFSIKSKPGQVFAYEIDKDAYPTNVRNVAGQRDFYTFNDVENSERTAELEDAFADIDNQGDELLKLLDSMPDGDIELEEKDKGNLFSYIAFLHTRNLQERKHLADSFGQMALIPLQFAATQKEHYHDSAKEALGEDYTFEIAESTRQSILDDKLKVEYNPTDQYFLGATLKLSKGLYAALMNLKKAVLVSTSTDSKHFVTSDNPVTHYAPENYLKPMQGLGYVNAVFQLPISPTRCLLLLNSDMKMKTFECDRGAVDHMNFYTYHYADRWIFSHINSKTIAKMFFEHKAKRILSVIDSPFDRAKRRKNTTKVNN